MREVVLGTAGHVDHGKTSLVRALTGIDTDRLKEEKERGITIELGFAFLDLPCGHRLGIVDVPGHERFVKNMVAGAAGIDLVAFVIAADEGIMPQTREHFEICSLLGVKAGCIIITKKDLVEPDWLDLVQEDINEYFAGSFLENAPVVAVSSTTGEGIEEVRNLLDKLVSARKFNEAYGPFRLPVDRVFTIKGFGAVVTGTSISGRIKVGDDITIFPRGTIAKIRGIQVHARDVSEVEAGNRTAINIQGVEKEIISRGDMIATPGCLLQSYILDADFQYLSGNKKPLKNRTRVRIHLGTSEIMGRIVLLEQEELEPGSDANVQLLLEKPTGVWPGDHYVIRSYSPIFTIGGGTVLNGSAMKRRRFKEINQEAFNLYHNGSAEDRAIFYLKESGFSGLAAEKLAVKVGVFGNRLKKILNGPISASRIIMVDSERQRMIEGSVFKRLTNLIKDILETFHAENPLESGLSKAELKSKLSLGLSRRLFQMALDYLVKHNEIVQDEAVVRLAGHKVSLKDDAKEIREELQRLFKSHGLKPPTLKEVFSNFKQSPQSIIQNIINVLVREEALKKVNEDLYFNAQSLTDLQGKLVEFLKKEGEINAQGFKSLAGLTRKFSIPLMEYFDKAKVTIRVGDKRILRGK
ncbi:MAG: selenocysteine-specific translation elongation factor [Thermodesulfobacteriota bacterium]|nr:selenocysteine-specific translation elongation factor [Thermodesulfobacteriota bacterium]